MLKVVSRSVLLSLFLAGTVSLQAQSSSESADGKALQQILYEIIEERGVEQAIARYNELEEDDSGEFSLDGEQLNRLGYRLLNEDKAPEAVAIFKFNAGNHPGTINFWDSLNDGYLAMGKYEKAAENYRKILAMLEEQELQPRLENLLRSKADMNLYKTEHFSPPSEETLHYVSYFGGNPAGRWDMENIDRFNRTDMDLTISYTGNNYYFSPVPNEIEELFYGEHPADVATGAIGGYFIHFIEQGKIADITGLWEEQGWNEVFSGGFETMSAYEGRQYFVPMAYQWNPVWYRRDIFEKHDLTPPGSWEELLDLCDRLNELGYAPFSISVQNWPPPVARWFTILNLRLNGAEFHRQVLRGQVSFKHEKIRRVFEHWRELFRRDAFPDSSHTFNYRDGIDAFTSGSAAMYNLGEWIFESLDEEQEAKLDFFAFPLIDTDVKKAEIVHAYGAFMAAGTRHPAEAKKLLAWLADTESQAANARANNRTVANIEVDRSLYTGVQQRIIDYLKDAEEFVPLLELGARSGFAREALGIFQEYWKNPEDIGPVLEKLEKARIEEYGKD